MCFIWLLLLPLHINLRRRACTPLPDSHVSRYRSLSIFRLSFRCQIMPITVWVKGVHQPHTCPDCSIPTERIVSMHGMRAVVIVENHRVAGGVPTTAGESQCAVEERRIRAFCAQALCSIYILWRAQQQLPKRNFEHQRYVGERPVLVNGLFVSE